MILDRPIAKLLDEAADILEFFLVKHESACSIPSGWCDDFNGGLEKSAVSGTSGYRVAIGYDDGGEQTASNYESDDEFISRRVYFTFSKSSLYSTAEDCDCDEGLTIVIDENGTVASIEDWLPTDDDVCASILGRTRLAPLLLEGNRMIPFPARHSRS